MKKIIILIYGIFFVAFVLFPVGSEAAVEKEEKIKLNDDLYVEIKAQVNFAMGQALEKYKGAEAAKKAIEAEERIYKKYGVTREELDKYITELSEKDVSQASKIIMKVAQRMQELMESTKKEPEPLSGENEVKGFPTIPLYPGAEFISGTEMGDTKWIEESLAKEGYIWYEFGKKLSAEYEEDPQGVDNMIVDFYKEKFAKRSWKYIGEGVRTHHWAKGDNAIGISFPADCTIEYRHMSVEEAQGNCGQLDENKFIEAFMRCAKVTQEVCKKWGIQSMADYQSQMANEEALEKLNKKIEMDLNEALKPYGVTFKRFKEIKEGYNFDEMMGGLYSEYEKEINEVQLGLIILTELME